MVVVDRLSKYSYFAPLPTSFNALRVANLFIDSVVKHHGFPKNLVSDRDFVFINDMWEEMLSLSGTKLHFTTAYHLQSDGQTEVWNRGLERYMRAFTADRPNKWANFLPWAGLALNCFHHEGSGVSPFTALYGRQPPLLVAAPPSTHTPPDVAVSIRQQGKLLVALQKNLEKVQQRMRNSANKHRMHVEFEVGERVLLKLRLYRQLYVAKPLSTKLSRRYYGPFNVVERIGPVGYCLKLPEGSRVHNVFHVNLLRNFVDDTDLIGKMLPAMFAGGRPVARLEKMVDRRTVWRDGKAVDEGLLHWADDNGEYPSWESMEIIAWRFPFLLEDKEPVMEGGVDTRSVVSAEFEESSSAEVEPVASFNTVERSAPEKSTEARRSRLQRDHKRPKHLEDFI